MQNNNFARASRVFVNFFAVTAQLQFQVDLTAETAKRLILPSLGSLSHNDGESYENVT